MKGPLYYLAKALVSGIQSLPLLVVARVGRLVGGLVYWVDRRHRRVAMRNLTMCFGHEKSAEEIKAIAQENFRRIGENFASAVKTASMSLEELGPHLEFASAPGFQPGPGEGPQRFVGAIGHFGNFELYARIGRHLPGCHRFATTYRGLRQASFNTLLQELREQSGCRFFERRFDAGPLKAFMNEPGSALGLLCDQHGGSNGLRLPFLGHECSTSPAPAIFALRYRCRLSPIICYRTGLARWRVEGGAAIATMENGHPRSAADIMLDVNRAFEAAVRSDPANWFWVHNRWKLPRSPLPANVAVGAGTESANSRR